VEQIWNRYFQYICSVLNPLDFQDFFLFLIAWNRWYRCEYTFFLYKKKYIRYVYISKLPFYLYHLFRTLENP
jgi:hypothetical protein